MPDRLEDLRMPVVPLDPPTGFVERLLRQISSELAPLLVNTHQIEETTMPETSVTALGGTTSAVTASVTYVDASAAINWLVDVLGFRVLERHDLPDGGVAHARLAWRTGMVFVSTRDAIGPWARAGHASLALNQPDPVAVDALYERSRAAGAEIIAELHDAPYGSHQFGVRDPEGNTWTLGTYLPVIPFD